MKLGLGSHYLHHKDQSVPEQHPWASAICAKACKTHPTTQEPNLADGGGRHKQETMCEKGYGYESRRKFGPCKLQPPPEAEKPAQHILPFLPRPESVYKTAVAAQPLQAPRRPRSQSCTGRRPAKASYNLFKLRFLSASLAAPALLLAAVPAACAGLLSLAAAAPACGPSALTALAPPAAVSTLGLHCKNIAVN
jgi:hypothetical protein